MFKPLSFPVLSPCSTIANLTAIEIEVHTEQSNTNIKLYVTHLLALCMYKMQKIHKIAER